MMWSRDETFADKAVKKCLTEYKSLPKKGKPQKDVEWTLLAGVLVAIQTGIVLAEQEEFDLMECYCKPTYFRGY